MASVQTQLHPEHEIPNLSGKVFFVTGGTAGIGKSTVSLLSKHQAEHIYFSGRNSQNAQAIIDEVNSQFPGVRITFIECDLASLQSVNNAASAFISLSSRLDVLICNAGVMALPSGLTKDGYEIQFGINHLGHALLIKLLLLTLLRSSDARIVNLSSQGYLAHPMGGIVFEDLRSPQGMIAFGPMIRYAQSKLANILYAAELARRYPSITSVSIHPGVINTGLMSGATPASQRIIAWTLWWKMTTPEHGAYNSVWAATCDKSKLVNGGYYEPVGKLTGRYRDGNNSKLAEQLWDWTEAELRDYRC